MLKAILLVALIPVSVGVPLAVVELYARYHHGERPWIQHFAQDPFPLFNRVDPTPALPPRYLQLNPPGTTAHVVRPGVDFTYAIDAHGRRVTPDQNSRKRKEHALFFGCSFTFGFGVGDRETLPYYFSKKRQNYRVYNYGLGSAGPQQMLARFEDVPLEKEVAEKSGAAFYILTVDAVRRALATMSTLFVWEIDPYYELGPGGGLERHNLTPRQGRPWTRWAYWWLAHSSFLDQHTIDFPLRVQEQGLELTTQIILKSRDLYRKRFGSENFYVVIYKMEFRDEILPILRAQGVRVIDLQKLDLEGLTQNQAWIPGDGHPTRFTHAVLADAIDRALPGTL